MKKQTKIGGFSLRFFWRDPEEIMQQEEEGPILLLGRVVKTASVYVAKSSLNVPCSKKSSVPSVVRSLRWFISKSGLHQHRPGMAQGPPATGTT